MGVTPGDECTKTSGRATRRSPPTGMVLRNRKSIRLCGYDYSRAGAYFITICSHERAMIFGRVIGDRVDLSEIGIIAREELIRSTEIRSEIELDEYEVMPNHIHAIVLITVGATGGSRPRVSGPRPRSLGALVGGFKSAATQQCHRSEVTLAGTIWQRNYHDRIFGMTTSLRQYDVIFARIRLPGVEIATIPCH